MKTIVNVWLAVVLLGIMLHAQTGPSSTGSIPEQRPATGQTAQTSNGSQTLPTNVPRVAPGSVIPVQLIKTVDSKKAKTGEEIEARVTQDMKNGSGEILMPKDTKVLGHVIEAQKRTKEQKESELGITFERAVMNGSEVSMPMSIQAVIVPPSQNASPNSASDSAGPSSTPGDGEAPTPTSNRAGGMGPGAQQQAPNAPMPSDNGASAPQPSPGVQARQQITGNTQGVIGDPNLRLDTATSASQPSVVSSEKDNVKLESGTMLLLRVTK